MSDKNTNGLCDYISEQIIKAELTAYESTLRWGYSYVAGYDKGIVEGMKRYREMMLSQRSDSGEV